MRVVRHSRKMGLILQSRNGFLESRTVFSQPHFRYNARDILEMYSKFTQLLIVFSTVICCLQSFEK